MRRITSRGRATIRVDDREILSFGGCSYLGLAGVDAIVEAGQAALGALGSTAQLPRHYGFQSPANLDAEEAARRFFDVDGAMYIATGYLFGLIAFAGLRDDYDVAILDEKAHFCLTDGARAAEREIVTFQHCDADDLARVVAATAASGKRFVVATDGVFPTFGRVPPLARYAQIIAPYDAWLLVDEAHGFGAVGVQGRGACEHEGIERLPRLARGGSTSKGFGAYGGLVLASAGVIDRLFTSPAARGAALGMSAGAAMTAASLTYLRANPDRFARVAENTRQMRRRLDALGLVCPPTPAPILAFEHGKARDMRRIQESLFAEGIFVTYSTYVGAGPEGALRIAVFADHEPHHLDRLANALARTLIMQEEGVL